MKSGLYAITPDEPDTGTLLSKVEAALAGGAAVVQYRNKTANPALQRTQASELLRLCRGHGVPFIVNDDAKLAMEIGADGAHLGAEDGDMAAARRLLGAKRLLGISCYNRIELAAGSKAVGADYIAFGSFFASTTKPLAVRATPDLIARAQEEFHLPVAAIGGITLENAAGLVEAGADWICVISALFDAKDIKATARAFADFFPTAKQHLS